MWKAIAWGVGLAVVNIAVSTAVSKKVNAQAKAAEAEYKKFSTEAKQGE